MYASQSFGLSWILDRLRSSYWFLPALLVVLAAALAVTLIALDRKYGFQPDIAPWWLFLSEAESARAILSTIATSMITVVSLAFSITIVVLTLASSQFGPRLLYNFMRDRANQFALGIFLACFVYCLLVLRTVGTDAEGEFVPHLSTAVAMLFAVISVAVLIHFIHHVADVIQANTVIATVRDELESIVCKMLPKSRPRTRMDREQADWARLRSVWKQHGITVPARRGGMFQAVDQNALVVWASANDCLIAMHHRPGEYILPGNRLFDLFALREAPSALAASEQAADVQSAFQFGHRRTLVQDIEFSFQQLVEIALRALSPGINDPFTAMSCIEELGSALALVAQRAPQPRILYDSEDRPRVLQKTVDFEGVADIAFNQIRQNSGAHPAVMLRMLEVMTALGQSLDDDGERAVLRRHAEAVYAHACRNVTDPGDRRDLDQRYERAVQALGPQPAGTATQEPCRADHAPEPSS